jgi:hypothetical protein
MKLQLTALLLLVILFAAAESAAAPADPREAVLGRWEGTSLCTKARTACHDEVVVYHGTPGATPDAVTVQMSKVVGGQELDMGTLHFRLDFAKRQMVGDFDNGRVHSRWTFTWTATEMKGTAVTLPEGTTIRNVSLHR